MYVHSSRVDERFSLNRENVIFLIELNNRPEKEQIYQDEKIGFGPTESNADGIAFSYLKCYFVKKGF